MLQYTKNLKTVIEAEIEVLTPLHISSGRSYQPSDVVRDEDSFIVIDENKLIKHFANDEKALAELEDSRLILQRFFENHTDLFIDDFMLYELESKTKKSVRFGMPLMSFSRKGADFKPYIPGSSLKGTLLSGILWDLNQTARGDSDKWTSDTFIQAVKKSFDRAGGTNLSDSEFANAILGKESANFAQKAFRVLDVELSNEDIGVYAVAMFHCDQPNGQGFSWSGSQKQHTTDFTKINYDLVEAVKPGTKIKIKIIVDNTVMNNVKFGELGSNVRTKPYQFGEVASAIFELAYNTLYSENEFFERTGHRKLSSISNELFSYASKIADDPKSNEIMFRLGWGMNYHGVTGFLWQDKITKRLNLPIAKYNKFPYPKSRRVVFDEKSELGTPGWVKMRINF